MQKQGETRSNFDEATIVSRFRILQSPSAVDSFSSNRPNFFFYYLRPALALPAILHTFFHSLRDRLPLQYSNRRRLAQLTADAPFNTAFCLVQTSRYTPNPIRQRMQKAALLDQLPAHPRCIPPTHAIS